MSQYDNTSRSTKYVAPQIKYKGTSILSGWQETSPIRYSGSAVPRMRSSGVNLLHRALVYNGTRMRPANDAYWYGLNPTSPNKEDVCDASAADNYKTTSCRYKFTYDSSFSSIWSSTNSSTRNYSSETKPWTAEDYMSGFDADFYGMLGAVFNIFRMDRVDNTGGASKLPATMYYTIMVAYMGAIDRRNGKYYSCKDIAGWLNSGAARPTASEWNNSFGMLRSTSHSLYWDDIYAYTFTTANKPNFTNSSIPEKFTCAQVKAVIDASTPIYSLKYRLHASVNGLNADNVAEVSVAGRNDRTNFITIDKSIEYANFSACVQMRGNRMQNSLAILPGMSYSACLVWYPYSNPHWSASSDNYQMPMGSSCDYTDYGYGESSNQDVNYSFKFTDGSSTIDYILEGSACYLYERLNNKTVQLQWDRTGWGTLTPSGSVYVAEADTDCIATVEY